MMGTKKLPQGFQFLFGLVMVGQLVGGTALAETSVRSRSTSNLASGKSRTKSNSEVPKAIPLQLDANGNVILPAGAPPPKAIPLTAAEEAAYEAAVPTDEALRNAPRAIAVPEDNDPPAAIAAPAAPSAPVVTVAPRSTEPKATNTTKPAAVSTKKALTPEEQQEMQDEAAAWTIGAAAFVGLGMAASYLFYTRNRYVDSVDQYFSNRQALKNRALMGEDVRELLDVLDRDITSAQNELARAEKEFQETEQKLSLDLQKLENQHHMSLGDSLSIKERIKNYLTHWVRIQKASDEPNANLSMMEKLLGWRYAAPPAENPHQINEEVKKIRETEAFIKTKNEELAAARTQMEIKIYTQSENVKTNHDYQVLIANENKLLRDIEKLSDGYSLTDSSRRKEAAVRTAAHELNRLKRQNRETMFAEKTFHDAQDAWKRAMAEDLSLAQQALNFNYLKISDLTLPAQRRIDEARAQYVRTRRKVGQELNGITGSAPMDKATLDKIAEFDAKISQARSNIATAREKLNKASALSDSDRLMMQALLDNSLRDANQLDNERFQLVSAYKAEHASNHGAVGTRHAAVQKINELEKSGQTFEVGIRKQMDTVINLLNMHSGPNNSHERHATNLKREIETLQGIRSTLTLAVFQENEKNLANIQKELSDIQGDLAQAKTGQGSVATNDKTHASLEAAVNTISAELHIVDSKMEGMSTLDREVRRRKEYSELFQKRHTLLNKLDEAHHAFLGFVKTRGHRTTAVLAEREALLQKTLARHQKTVARARAFLTETGALDRPLSSSKNPRRTLSGTALEVVIRCASLIMTIRSN